MNLVWSGYLGVDVFFVISGFLITQLIKNGVEGGEFRFSAFYFRRAKRLLPAAYITFLLTALLAPFFLTSAEMQYLWKQLVGAVTFTANVVLWRQSDYFDSAAELKPLLHIWSLAVEEQYYLLLPAILVLVPRRFWLPTLTVALLSGFVLFMFLVRWKPTATFYLLPGRGWELAIGSVGAVLVIGARLNYLLKIVFWPALLAFLILPFCNMGTDNYWLSVILICPATLVVILRKHPFLSTGLGMHSLARIGDMSYSVYLVHWPIFAFLNNVEIVEYGGAQHVVVRVTLVALSLVLAYLLNRFVEEPIRRSNVGWEGRFRVLTVVSSAGLLVVAVGIALRYAPTGDSQFKHSNYGFGLACDFAGNFEPISECRNSDKPEMLIWGDSNAMHLVDGIRESKALVPPQLVQATRSVCGPAIGLSALNDRASSRKSAESCIRFNDSVVDYLKETDSVKVVVLASAFNYFVNKDQLLLKRDKREGEYRVVESGAAESLAGLKRTAEAVRAMGKRVVVIAPPPSSGVDSVRCMERLNNNMLTLGGATGCTNSTEAYRRFRGSVLALMDVIPQQAGIEVISFDSYLCDSGLCKTSVDGMSIYLDSSHLSRQGSVVLANKMSLVEKILREAK